MLACQLAQSQHQDIACAKPGAAAKSQQLLYAMQLCEAMQYVPWDAPEESC